MTPFLLLNLVTPISNVTHQRIPSLLWFTEQNTGRIPLQREAV